MSDKQKSELSVEATFKAMKEQEGQGIGDKSMYALEQREAVGGDIRNVDRLADVGEIQRREEQKAAAATVSAAAMQIEVQAQRDKQMASAIKQIDARREEGNFLKGEHWDADIKLVESHSQAYFAKYKADPASVTPEQSIQTIVQGTEIRNNAVTPEQIEQVVTNPGSRQAHNLAISMDIHMMRNGHMPEEYSQMSRSERLEALENKLTKLAKENPKEFHRLNTKCHHEAQTCEEIVRSADKAEFSKAYSQMHTIMIEKYGEEYDTAAKNDVAMDELTEKALSEVAIDNPAGAKLVQETMGKFKGNEESVNVFKSLYEKATGFASGAWLGKKDGAVETKKDEEESLLTGVIKVAEKVVSDALNKDEKPTEEKSAIDQLGKEARAAVETIKETCSCSHSKPEKEAPKPEAVLAQKMQSGDTPAKAATEIPQTAPAPSAGMGTPG